MLNIRRSIVPLCMTLNAWKRVYSVCSNQADLWSSLYSKQQYWNLWCCLSAPRKSVCILAQQLIFFCNLCRHQAFDERDNVLVHDPSDLRSRRVVLPLRADMWCCDTQTFISATLFHLICMNLFSANLHSFIFWDNHPFHPFRRQSAQWMWFTMILWVFDFLPNVWS